jgi:hypothetical protein
MREYQVHVMGGMAISSSASISLNLKPGGFDKPPGKPRQYYWMNHCEMNSRILWE